MRRIFEMRIIRVIEPLVTEPIITIQDPEPWYCSLNHSLSHLNYYITGACCNSVTLFCNSNICFIASAANSFTYFLVSFSRSTTISNIWCFSLFAFINALHLVKWFSLIFSGKNHIVIIHCWCGRRSWPIFHVMYSFITFATSGVKYRYRSTCVFVFSPRIITHVGLSSRFKSWILMANASRGLQPVVAKNQTIVFKRMSSQARMISRIFSFVNGFFIRRTGRAILTFRLNFLGFISISL